MSTLSPHSGLLSLTPVLPRLWPGPPTSACWRLRYLAGDRSWRLDYGDGWIEYGISTPWNPWGANTFDVVLVDYSGQAPATVTVWPYTAVPCPCPDEVGPGVPGLVLVPVEPRLWQQLLRPAPGLLRLTAFPPSLGHRMRPCLAPLYLRPYQPHMYQVPATLRLSPWAPAIAQAADLIVTPCCPDGVPRVLPLWIVGEDGCACVEGEHLLYWWDSLARWQGSYHLCGLDLVFSFQCLFPYQWYFRIDGGSTAFGATNTHHSCDPFQWAAFFGPFDLTTYGICDGKVSFYVSVTGPF